MQKTIKKSVSMLLAVIMVFSLFTIVPFTAGAAVDDVLSEDDYLTFTAETDGATVTLNVASGSNLQYDLNGTGLTSYTAGTSITLANAGDYVRFSGTGTKFNSSKHFSITGKVACSGNVMSLRLNGGKVQGLENLCFRYMFYNCTGLTTAPDLPETDLKAGCYNYMFNGCTSLTTAPDLPATTLAESCYNSMFMGCTSLTTAPDLPATVLAINCYLSMFNGCTSLTEAPELPATTLANYCYSNMFRDCQSLTEAPELPATNLAQFCYASMFYGCTSLTKAPELPATDLAVSCYNYMFYGCSSLTELPALPATTLQSSCYYGMFNYCSKICISDEAVTLNGITYSAEYRIPTTGEGTSANNALNYMFANTGGKFKGTPNINTIYYVPAPAPETFKVYVKKLTGGTYTIENLTGETT
ncbi:MAG: leucine-rich repeat protein, partial [Ruminococcus sp.]|nr:leucine-rich repeat protein [Ruminococcus sp.]